MTTGAAAASGASFGGGLGILASLVALSIPAAGPVIAGGGLAAVLMGLGVGATAGGFIGALKHMGLSHEEAPLYEEALRRGALMLVVKVDEPLELEVIELMKENGGRDLKDEVDTWRLRLRLSAGPGRPIRHHLFPDSLDPRSRAARILIIS